MIRRTIFTLLCILQGTCQVAIADHDWCGWSNTRLGDASPQNYGEEIRAKFIFVGFYPDENPEPGDIPPTDAILRGDQQPETVALIKEWLDSHSQGSFTFDSNPPYEDIILMPGESLENPSDSASPWMADLQPDEYLNPDLADPNYKPYYSGLNGGPDISEWWTGESESYLCSEILYKIYQAYGGSNSPFGEYSGDGNGIPESEKIDSIFFVFLTRDDPFGGYGGTTWVEVHAEKVFEFDSGGGLDFFGNIKFSNGLSKSEQNYHDLFQGTMQLHSTTDWDEDNPDPAYHVDNAAAVILHEFAHTFGFKEGPPSLSGLVPGSLGRYYWGNLNVSCQKFYPGHGVPILGLYSLEMTDWIETVDFTGKNLFGVDLYDVRKKGGLLDDHNGVIFKFRMEGQEGLPDQYFLFAYHSGMGIDYQGTNSDGDYPVKARGLEVQHVVSDIAGQWPTIVDIESAYGLYTDIGVFEMPNNEWPPPDNNLGTPVAAPGEWGFDNWDLWWVNNQFDADHLRTLLDGDGQWAGFTTYLGSKYDFFTSNEYPTQDGQGVWSNSEFSFRTSPSGFWYSSSHSPLGSEPNSFSGDEFRLNDQSIVNPMYVKVRSQDDQNHKMVVDFLSAPCEDVEIVSGDQYQPGSLVAMLPVHNPDFVNVLTDIDVYISPNLSGEPLVFVENLAYSPGGEVFSFEVGQNHGTEPNGGMVVLKYNNTFSDISGIVYSDPIHIDADYSPYEELVSPQSGDHLFIGKTTRVKWTAHFDPSIYTKVAIEFNTGSGWQPWAVLLDDLPNGNVFYVENGFGYCDLMVPENMLSPGLDLRLQFYSHVGPIESAIVSGIKVFPRLPEFVDASEEAFSNPSDGVFEGTPYAISPISVAGTQSPEFKGAVLSLPTVNQQEDGLLWKNDSSPGSILLEKFDYVDGFIGGVFESGASGVAVGDYDGDGDDDFFACNPGEGRSYLFRSIGTKYERVTLDPSEIVTDGAKTAQWVDYDHDGDLDLFIGRDRKNITGPVMPDVLFECDSNGGLELVSSLGGVVSPAMRTPTETVLWTDLEGNGFWNVIIGGGKSGGEIRVYTEEDGFRYEITDYPFSGVQAASVKAADLNLDGQLDVVLLNPTEDRISVFFGGGNGFSADSPIELPEKVHEISIADVDGDMWPDFLLSSGDAGMGMMLLLNKMGTPEYGVSFLDVSAEVDLPRVGNCKGFLPTDVDLNGTLDAFVGHESPFVVDRIIKNDGVPGYNDWLGVRLHSARGAQPYGAIVSLEGMGNIQLGTQVFGSGGRGSQGPGNLVFRLDDDYSPYKVYIDWPSRVQEVYQIPAGNQYVDLDEPTIWTMIENSSSFELVFDPTSMSWVFTWETENWTPAEDDWVSFNPDSGCEGLVGESLIPGVTPGVTSSIEYHSDPGTGVATYLHRVVWDNAPCISGCRISFVTHSGNQDLGLGASAPKTVLVAKRCPLSY